jgi:hypothetical protein
MILPHKFTRSSVQVAGCCCSPEHRHQYQKHFIHLQIFGRHHGIRLLQSIQATDKWCEFHPQRQVSNEANNILGKVGVAGNPVGFPHAADGNCDPRWAILLAR